MSASKRHEIDTTLLVELGRLAPPERQDDLRERLESEGVRAVLLHEDTGRAFRTDPEALAGGGVADFLRELARPMKALGATLDSVEQGDHDDETGLTVIVDSVVEILHGPDEDPAEVTTGRTFGLVNRRLAASGSAERLYVLEDDDDGLCALFLTERMTEALEGDDGARPSRPDEKED